MSNQSNIFDDEKVAVSPIIIARDKVENLTDRPNINSEFGGDGMTGVDLKKAFDKIGIYVATRLKNLTEILKSGEAGGSIGIKGWNDEVTTIKSMLNELKLSTGASKIGTGMLVNGVKSNLQNVIDNLYALISSYELDDIYEIKYGLQYDKTTGDCAKITSITENLNSLNDYVEKIQTLLSINEAGWSAVRIDNIEKDVDELYQSKNSPFGIATLNAVGKISNELDASKITSGKLPLSCIPDVAFERTFEVATNEARFALTYEQVQEGDIVIVSGNPDLWFKVIDDTKLHTSGGYREIIGGTTAVAEMAREFDINYNGANSISNKFEDIAGAGRSVETIKGNSIAIAQNTERIVRNTDEIMSVKGLNWSGETITDNAIEIANLIAGKDIYFSNITVLLNAFVRSTAFIKYGYSCVIPLSKVRSTHFADVIFSHNDAVSVNYSPIVETFDGGVKIYAREKPISNIVIPKIKISKEG